MQLTALGDRAAAQSVFQCANPVSVTFPSMTGTSPAVALLVSATATYVGSDVSPSSQLATSKTAIGQYETFDIVPQNGGQIALRARSNSKFVTAENAGQGALVARSSGVGAWELFQLQRPCDTDFESVVLRAAVNGKYVRQTAVYGPLVADFSLSGTSGFASDAKFQLRYPERTIPSGSFAGPIAMYSVAHGRYATNENNGGAVMNTSRTSVGAWERLLIVPLGANQFAIQALSNGLFVSADTNLGQTAPLIANRSAVGLWERFAIRALSDNIFAFQALSNGKWVRAGGTGFADTLTASSLYIGDYEQFRIEILGVNMSEVFRSFASSSGCAIVPNMVAYSSGSCKVKLVTRGPNYAASPEIGVAWLTEAIAPNGYLWQQEAFPKLAGDPRATNGVQHVWNQVQTQGAQIAATCTAPDRQQGASWSPGLPRVASIEDVGRTRLTQLVPTSDQQRAYPSASVVSATSVNRFGTMYPPYMADLGGTIGWRWIVDIGLDLTAERYSLDLGPEVGRIAPQFGLVGYHDGTNPSLRRYAGGVQTQQVPLNSWMSCNP